MTAPALSAGMVVMTRDMIVAVVADSSLGSGCVQVAYVSQGDLYFRDFDIATLEPLSAEVVVHVHADTVRVICRHLEIKGIRVRAKSVPA